MNILHRFHNIPIRYRLILIINIVVLGSGFSLFYVGMIQYQQTIISQTVNHLITIRESRIHDIREYLMAEMDNIDILSSQPIIKKALASYDSNDFGPGVASVSHQKTAAIIGEYFSYYRQKSRYYDLFLISMSGDIFYTDVKEADLGTNLMSGKYRNSQLADVFRRSKFLLQSQVSSIQFYAPSNENAIFIATPVFDHGKVVGVAAIQLNLSELHEVISSRTGLMRSGEVVAAAADGDHAILAVPLRNAAATVKQITLHSAWAKPLQRALQGKKENGTAYDYQGVEVEAAWGYVPELKLGVVVKIDRSELLEPVIALRESFIIAALLILFLTMFIGVFFSRSITIPIEKLRKTASYYAHGKFDIRSEINSSDEIGQLASTFNSMADNMKDYNHQIRSKNIELQAYSDELEQRVEDRTATLSAANEEIKSFAYIVSHDLRSPLVNMKGFTGELDYTLKEISQKVASIQSNLKENERKEIQLLIEEDIPESMQFINRSVDKMDHMLSAILNLSRLGRRELKIEAVDLHAVSNDILSSLAYQLEQAKAETELGYLPVINNDRVVMEQIMGNLIDNAVKYLDPERPGKIEIASFSSDNGITISVRDNGRGILPEEKEKVFQIFRRGIHQDVEGEGMGLAYVQTLVRSQGGKIDFEAAADYGTIFTVFLPRQKDRGHL